MSTRPNDRENEMPIISDYLWDRCGTPDPEIQHLESVLAEFRHAGRPLLLPAETPAPAKSRILLRIPRLAAAAILLLAVALPFFLSTTRVSPPVTGPAWNIAKIEGNPQVGAQSLSANQTAAKLYVGQTLTTNSSSRASLSENDLGEIQIDPDSRVRLLQSGPDHKRLQLDVGTIHAAIWAPPGQFVVNTPSAIAVDLGCAYTLHVAADGSGTIRTTLGWVGFHLHGRDSFIPAGAMCAMRPQIGPGTPCFEDASKSFREALRTFDQADPSSETASAALATILAQARPRDGLTLWHLLSRTSGPARARVYARFASLVPPPNGITREGILQLNSHMLDLYWNALDLGDISTWRYWEQSSDPKANPSSQSLSKKDLALKKSQ